MEIVNTEIFHLHAEFCKTLANPTRLMILALLSKREMNVGEIAEVVKVRISNVSQHLSALRSKNIVEARKEAQTVYYSLVDPRLMEACHLIRSVLLEDLKHRGMIAHDFEADKVVTGE